MLGWLGPKALAASALAVNLFFIFGFTGTGLVSAAAPLIAAALGERSHAVRDVRRSFRAAIHLALIYVLLAWLELWHTEELLLLFGQDPALSREAARYMAERMDGFPSSGAPRRQGGAPQPQIARHASAPSNDRLTRGSAPDRAAAVASPRAR